MKDQILKLRAEGLSYRKIQKILGCSRSTISYHLGTGQKEKLLERSQLYRQRCIYGLKQEAGGSCQRCGYNRCLAALHFHHIDPHNKSFVISRYIRTKGWTSIDLKNETKKCLLLCSNCHSELHHCSILEK